MSQWQWLMNNGVAIAVLAFLATCMIAVARWMAPRIDSWITTSIQTQEKLQKHMDKADEKVETQQAMCADNKVTLDRTEARTDANLQLWRKACDILRHAAPELLPNQKLIDEVQRKVDEMEQIASKTA